jgi:hypothetical protein
METVNRAETDSSPAASTDDKRATCDEVGRAVETGKVGDIVAKHEKLILQYYEDVQKQASESFKAAKFVSYIGFAVLILTWLYTLGFDLAKLLPQIHSTAPSGTTALGNPTPSGYQPAIGVGVISGVLIEFIAGVNFWLYSKASKQFAAFHICLERTHRYLVAYKIGEETGSRREIVLERLACIMASAPMITNQNIDSTQPKPVTANDP